jgi:hypothetical protein
MIPRFEQPTESRFYQRLESGFKQDAQFRDQDSNARISALVASVTAVTNQADHILSQIVRTLPQYTLHNKRHILNVLALMDALTPDEVLNKLTPLECALCILAAYVHDLGMALPEVERVKLTGLDDGSRERLHFERFKSERFGAELRQIQKWRQDGRHDQAHIVDGHILGEYVRSTHADRRADRINAWLDNLKQVTAKSALFKYGNHDFQTDLKLIAASHNQDARWLRSELTRNLPPDAFLRPFARGERSSAVFPSLLLRLADLMDFDASRAPDILFRHAGVTNTISVGEWAKHLAIDGWDLNIHGQPPTLQYSVQLCPDPATEKTIKEYLRWIDLEIRSVREELDWHNKAISTPHKERFRIHLPLQGHRTMKC